ncbi:receptor-like protein 9a [Dioscorea cayenensis subsp. rotundata]|uniref:Receptor-like protein 9a n=1 Tax=Dioscorea cayennensis subsp. rotundata TaxID=55577 RepID=A0AB40AT80_DIOCR|nr:receptor-like protein 9a [Dioscorea cayenensis subsp. rotundata]
MYLFWMLLLVHHVLQQPNGCFACVEQEKIALLDIKSAFTRQEINADPYSIFESWNKNMECCSWDRVHCSPTTKHVRSLDLHDSIYSYGYTLNISLFLPFRELRSLTLSYNYFNNCIPSNSFGRMAKLDNLEYLDLSGNYFDFKALSSLAALGSLKALSLRDFWMENEFFTNGSLNVHKQSQMISELLINVVVALSKLSKLKYLDLSGNYLNGTIIPYLGGISSLKTLDLTNNNMNEGLDHLNAYQLWSNMSKLDNLYLLGNSLNGMKIIPFLIIAPSLKTLDLSDNNMEGSLSFKACQALSNMSRLENLYLSWNSLNEKIIPCLVGASSLKSLDLFQNKLGERFSLKGLVKYE